MLAGWRRNVAKQQVCPACNKQEVALVIFGRTNLNSEQMLDELFGVGNWVDGGASADPNLAFQCVACSHRFGSAKDLFGIFGFPELAI